MAQDITNDLAGIFCKIRMGEKIQGLEHPYDYYLSKLLFENYKTSPEHFTKELLDDISIMAFNNKDIQLLFDSSIESYKFKWDENNLKRLRFNQHFYIEELFKQNNFGEHLENTEKMTSILQENRKKINAQKLLTVTMTSCKRLDLFKKTVYSFIHSCLDNQLIDEWIVVDDNSSEEDRSEMKRLFPFIKYIFKNEDQKGHANSMNILREVVKTPFIFHMEDDWVFFRQEKYLTICLDIISQDDRFGQCLVNREYGERDRCHDIVGSEPCYTSINNRYYKHLYAEGEELEKYKNQKSCAYWPHYSLRPGIMKTSVWKIVGEYNKEASHFEMEYAHRYVKNFETVFMDNIYCLHTGRCTFERDDPNKVNAYKLNNEVQFGQPINEEIKKEKCDCQPTCGNCGGHHSSLNCESGWNPQTTDVLTLSSEEEKLPDEIEGIKEYDVKYRMETFIINLKRRPDRLKQFIIKNHDILSPLKYKVFEAIDGKELKPFPKHLKLFETGDYNYRKGIMGCALSHISLWRNFVVKEDLDCILVLEDDVELCENFLEKLIQAMKRVPENNWDILFLGHFLYPNLRNKGERSNELPIVQQWDKEKCMKNSMGGTIGYLISKSGVIKMLNHIKDNGMYNAIDWVMFKNANNCNIFYSYPHLVYSECATQETKPDSDIQYDHSFMCQNDYENYNFNVEFFLTALGQKGVCYYDENNRELLERSSIKMWKGIIKQESNSESKIVISSFLPKRDVLLSKIIFIMEMDKKYVKEKIKNLPIYHYTIKDMIVLIPATKLNPLITVNVVLDGGFLHVENPV